jgi:RNA polymerase sigma-70 factor (ECF subfamily)
MVGFIDETRTTRRIHETLGEALERFQYRMQTDDEATDLVQAGNREAFDALVMRYRDRIYGLAIASLRNEEQKGEVVRQALSSAIRDLHSAGRECSTITWLYLHGLCAVFSRLDETPREYRIEKRPAVEEDQLRVA